MTLTCEQCEKPIEFRPRDRELITIKCSCGAIYAVDPAKMDYKRVLRGRKAKADMRAVHDVCAELEQARRYHPDMNSPHEGYAIILEELDELWDEVRRKDEQHDLARMRAEACQVAAMAIRFMTDICGEGTK